MTFPGYGLMGSTLALSAATPAPAPGTPAAPLAGRIPLEDEVVFTPAELEQLAWRRFNPHKQLNALFLTSALDAFDVGELMAAARVWVAIVERDPILGTVKSKREEAVSLRPIAHVPVDDSPEAADQAASLEIFYRNLRAGSAVDRHVTGKSALLLQQMMESASYKYAVHHLRFAADPSQTHKLPSGRTIPTLTATFDQVPLEFFENRTGELRFLGLNGAYTGTPLEPKQWMVTAGPGLMKAGCILHFNKRLAWHDWVNFSEKFGQPGVLGHCSAAQGTSQGDAMKAAVRSVAGNYRGVIFGAPENKIEFLWPQGGTGSGNLPMPEITKEVDRQFAILYLGADLSTISRGDEGVGASLQGTEQVKRTQADCVRVSETLQATVDPLVIEYFFGSHAPVLAKTVVVPPDCEDRKLFAEIIRAVVGLGAEVPIEPVLKRLGVPMPKEGEKIFKRQQAKPGANRKGEPDPAAEEDDEEDVATNSNVAPDQGLGRLYARARHLVGEQLGTNLRPLGEALHRILQEADPAKRRDLAHSLHANLPQLAQQIIRSPKTATAYYRILSAAAASGLNPTDRKE